MYSAEQHTAIIGGMKIPYRSICQDHPINNTAGVQIGTVFSYAYIQEDAPANRPVLFAFNGGPGSSSLWLHMGMLGPKHVNCDQMDSLSGSGNFTIEDNPYSPLDVCDIVIFDPIGTGFGLENDHEAAKYAYGFVNDARVMAEVIETWIIENNRWLSKKYLLGESYGSLRTVAVANYLMGGCAYEGCVSRGISIDGIINIGNIIVKSPNASDYTEDERYLEESVSLLPSFAATAWYYSDHKEGSLEEAVARAYRFCAEKYVSALYQGNRLEHCERSQLAEELSDITGIDSSVLFNQELRITAELFTRWYKEYRGLSLSLYDTRFSGPYTPAAMPGDPVGDDEMMSRCMHGFLGGFQFITKEYLGLAFNRRFQVINFNVNDCWPYDSVYTPFDMLQALLNRSRNFRIFIGNGVFDLVTSVGQVAYTVSQLRYDEGQVTVREYPAGHMPYLGLRGGDALAKDIRQFIQEGETC